MKQICLCLSVCLLPFFQLKGQDYSDSLNTEHKKISVIPNFTKDLGHILSSPFRINGNSALFMAGFSAVTTSLMFAVDTPVHRQFNGNDTDAMANKTAGIMTAPGRLYDHVGTDLFLIGASGLITGTGFILKDNKLARTGLTALEAVVFTELASGLLKTVTGRMRPDMKQGNLEFEPVNLEEEEGKLHRSLPSGHTSKMFALATVIGSSYDSPWVKIPVYTLAGSAALQRIEANKHWVSDVVAGAALGYFMGRTLAKRNGLTKGDFNVLPVVGSGTIGLNIQF